MTPEPQRAGMTLQNVEVAKPAKRGTGGAFALATQGLWTLLLLVGCAFDVSHVKQRPATYTALAAPGPAFVLNHDVKATVGSGFPTRLKAGTRWRQVGDSEHGAVFATTDQIVTVEASNIYEAQLVVSAGAITGFYLPVEKSFVAVSSKIPIQTKPLETPSP